MMHCLSVSPAESQISDEDAGTRRIDFDTAESPRQEPDGSWYMDLDDFDEIEEAPPTPAEEPAAINDGGAARR